MHPCLSCGACCAAYLVAFHWSEADPALGGTVPAQHARPWDAHRLALRGTDARDPRCVALEGSVGTQVHCRIYAQRPSPCRMLRPAWEEGAPSDQCDRARARHGLPPLQPDDWRLSMTAVAADPVLEAPQEAAS